MKKFLSLFLCLLLLFSLFGCKPKEIDFPINEPTRFSFTSGAGAWSTELFLYPDGTFTGSFHDSNMGEIGDGYPHGTVYTSDFEGRFIITEKQDKNTYALSLAELTNKYEPKKDWWIEDQILYRASEPYGLEDGETFFLYTPKKATAELSEMFLSWWPLRFEKEQPEALGCYGIENVEGGSGFFSDPEY
ncbi:MAG: hypothetical protein II351_01570 [Clostridia bacterium]|nr:hypothetical protein [Clostridia bacterium]